MTTTKQQARTEKLQAAHDKLQEAVAAIVTGDDWKAMLEVMSKFHRYSLNNQLMIFCQRPDATHVAGFNRWKSLGRLVQKGEKGIAIFAPCTSRVKIEDDNGDERSINQLRGFRLVYVFDISQTAGDELPLDACKPERVAGAAPAGAWDRLVDHAATLGFTVHRKHNSDEGGYCDFASKEIAVREDVDDAQALKTLIHEVAHATLHSDRTTPRDIAEVEVESIAYVVADALGLDTSGYSFNYVARWSGGDLEKIQTTAGRVTTTAKAILGALTIDDSATEEAAR